MRERLAWGKKQHCGLAGEGLSRFSWGFSWGGVRKRTDRAIVGTQKTASLRAARPAPSTRAKTALAQDDNALTLTSKYIGPFDFAQGRLSLGLVRQRTNPLPQDDKVMRAGEANQPQRRTEPALSAAEGNVASNETKRLVFLGLRVMTIST